MKHTSIEGSGVLSQQEIETAILDIMTHGIDLPVSLYDKRHEIYICKNCGIIVNIETNYYNNIPNIFIKNNRGCKEHNLIHINKYKRIVKQ